MKRPPAPAFVLAGHEIAPGTRARIEIPIAPLYIQAEVSLAAIVVHGRKPGPRLWLSAGIHGDELNGIAIVQQVLHAIEPKELSGTLVAIPVVNAFGLLQQSRYLPDRRDLNRSFPGSAKGSLAARIAHLFMTEIASRCTHGIDLHTAAIHRDNLPQIRANLGHRDTLRMARAFAAPVTIHANLRDGSLRQAAAAAGVSTLLYEAGEALRLSRDAVRVGRDGTLRVMRSLGMLPENAKAVAPPTVESAKSKWVRAPKAGMFVLETELGERLKKGQLLGTLHSRLHEQFFAETSLPVRSPLGGIVIGLCRNPLANVGDALVHIAPA